YYLLRFSRIWSGLGLTTGVRRGPGPGGVQAGDPGRDRLPGGREAHASPADLLEAVEDELGLVAVQFAHLEGDHPPPGSAKTLKGSTVSMPKALTAASP